MQDEQGRHVAEENQVMRDFAKDTRAQSSADIAYDKFKSQVDGVAGVSNARSQNSMKYADHAVDGLWNVNAEAAKAMAVPAQAATASGSMTVTAMPGTSYNTIQAPAADASTRVIQYTQRAKYIAGRAFFQNGNQWIDNNVSAQNSANSVRVKFGSDEYFTLLEQHPEARPWLALGQNVKLLLGSNVYDIYSDTGKT